MDGAPGDEVSSSRASGSAPTTPMVNAVSEAVKAAGGHSTKPPNL
jgi:hypothetical protein